MSETHFDQYEHYNYDHEKKLYSNHSGRLRTKKEAEQHTNRNDPCGHSRKLLTKMMNTEQNKRHPSTSDKNWSSLRVIYQFLVISMSVDGFFRW